MASAAPVLELRNVAIRYGNVPVVSDASFAVNEGEFVTLLGPSGSGKTSLLRAIAGFTTPSAGEVLLRGERVDGVPPFERDVGMVFQNYALFPHMTVEQNLSFGPRMMRIDRRELAQRVDDALAQVRLSDYRARYPHELSGGQQQRVAIARALAIRPSLLLLDEPMSNLDARLRAQMRTDLLVLLKNVGMTALAVTHNQEEALAMSDRIIVMSQGAIRQIGTPTEIYTRPIDAFVGDFIGDANVIRARYAGAQQQYACFDSDMGVRLYASPDTGQYRDRCVLLVRPEAIRVSPASAVGNDAVGNNRLCGSVASRAYMGAFVELRVNAGPQQILVKKPIAPGNVDPAIGDDVTLEWDSTSVVALNAQ